MTTTDPNSQAYGITNDELLDQVARVASEDNAPINRAQVGAVLAAWHAIREGDPIGTIRKDPETGAVAIRVEDKGMHIWRVSLPDGHQYNDLQPTLEWPTV